MVDIRIVAIAGVSGSGKTTVGRYLAKLLQWPFWDGDDFHPETNIRKMQKGIPLTDNDRWPWLASIRNLISSTLETDRGAVIACSALKQSYRDYLDVPELQFVFLKGSYAQIDLRLRQRQQHFMPAELLASQFRELEEPTEALTFDVALSVEAIAQTIQQEFGL
ncbi:MAG: gluconokinase [Cyanobacteria bacterium P01_F01_bin.33]